MIYEDDALVGELTRELVNNGDTVFQVHRLAATEREHVARLLDAFDPHGTILDAGCGVGAVASMMRKQRPDLDFILLNISQAQLDMCPGEFAHLHCSFHDISLEANSVDGAMFNYSLGHGDIEQCMSEAARVIKAGGILFIYDLSTEDNSRLIEVLDYCAYSVERMISSATNHGFVLDQQILPENTHTEHFMDKMDRAMFEAVFEGVRPVILRFIKP